MLDGSPAQTHHRDSMVRELPSGEVTLLFTDVEGSTRLLHALGAESYAVALVEHRRIVRDACLVAGGAEVDTQGDAFFFAFPTASAAAAAAARITEALTTGPIHVRIGVHTGTPLLTDEGYVGDDVHLAARIAATARGGQVVISGSTAGSLDVEVMDLGEHLLKDIDGAVPLFQLGTASFPPLRTISNTNLPKPTSSFLGRERELAEVLRRVERGARLTTLTGPGGTGKTRLAIEAAFSIVGNYKAGVFWIGLGALRDPSLVTDTISQTLGAKDGLADHIGEREMLLVIDNFEQVVEAAPALSALLSACPNLTLLVTSRELLRIQGEIEYAVPPLDAAEAIELFSARSGLPASAEIAELCVRLDALPLAVELAAARTSAMSPAMILQRLSQKLDLLKGGRDADPRQRTLRTTIEWSFDLLTEDERQLFARLSVFAGGWTLEGAEAVTDAEIDVLQSLVEKSLVRFANDRYQMLATIREYASEQSAADVELESRHARFYCDVAERTNKQLRGADEAVFLDRLEADHDNIRAALAWSISADPTLGLRIAYAMGRFWWMRGANAEGRRWLDALLERSDRLPRDLLAVGHADRAAFAELDGDWETVRFSGHLALEIASELDQHEIAAHAIEALIGAYAADERWSEVDALTEEAKRRARASGNRFREAATLFNHGELLRDRGDLVQARSLMEQARRLAEELGSQEGVATSLLGIGSVMRAQGDLDGAMVVLQRALAEVAALTFDERISSALTEIAAILATKGQPEAAARLVGAAESITEHPNRDLGRLLNRVTAQLTAALGEGPASQLRTQGRALSVTEALVLAGVPDDAVTAPERIRAH
jgi:predicted ATPase/class 3 adenylate cyclase